ncbi:MAG: hypothetical protein WKF40_01365 [Thermoleophilaceae bacterium]
MAGFVLSGDPPDPTEKPAGEVVKFYADQGDGALVGLVLIGLGLTLLVHLRQLPDAGCWGRPRSEDGVLPRVAFAGTVIIAAGFSFDSTLILTLHEGAKDIGPAGRTGAGRALRQRLRAHGHRCMFMFLVGVGVSIVRTGALPKWLGVVALLLAATTATPVGFVAFVGAGVLIAVMSAVLAIRAGREPHGRI